MPRLKVATVAPTIFPLISRMVIVTSKFSPRTVLISWSCWLWGLGLVAASQPTFLAGFCRIADFQQTTALIGRTFVGLFSVT